MLGSRIGTSLFRAFAIASFSVLLGSVSVHADLLLQYDFNDASDPAAVPDVSGNENNAEVLGAAYTDAGGGRRQGDLPPLLHCLAGGIGRC